MNFIARQPNGLLCRFSNIVDDIIADNLTEQEYIDMCKKEAMEEAERKAKEELKKHIQPFDNVILQFKPKNRNVAELKAWAKQVGANEERVQTILMCKKRAERAGGV